MKGNNFFKYSPKGLWLTSKIIYYQENYSLYHIPKVHFGLSTVNEIVFIID